jgi:hypothetical protein
MLNSLTALGAELEGRSYGGGLLKVEPKEADKVPMPSLALLEKASDDLRAMRPQLGRCLRNSQLEDALGLVDRVLLVKHLGLSEEDVKSLRAGRVALAARRAARSGKPS